MRTFIVAAAAFSLSLSAFACTAPLAADDSSEASEAAQTAASTARTQLTSYRADFSVAGARYTLVVDVTQPTTIVTDQVVRSSQISSDSARCDAYLRSFAGRVDIRVLSADGSVAAQKGQTAWFNTSAAVTDCPADGVFVDARPVTELLSEVMVDGLELTAGGKAVHVPAGYALPGVLMFDGAVTYEPTSKGTFLSHREPGRADSSLAVPRGNARFEVPASLDVRVGINPTFSTATGYDQRLELTLLPAR